MTVLADPLRARGSEVALLGDILARGGFALESVPQQVKDLLRSDAWRHFITKLGKEIHHERFAEFIAAPPLAGLGTSVEMLRRVLAGDIEALDLLDRALQNPASKHAGSNRTSKTGGTTREQALRKLRKDAPTLHADVIAGRLTAHAAMVKAGFRHKTFTVRADSPESVAATLRRQLDPEAIAKLVHLLQQEG